ncbi:hypothetical protein Zmor_025688 [Zophobas morio]|uniref:Uncharacterized protein n=1 Tax=Zophobas morio TaxID=2755281 RepID=A0AA38HS58_9CUCU|nr:hypothetical protein Zmor_025688 [Zophobas morio]
MKNEPSCWPEAVLMRARPPEKMNTLHTSSSNNRPLTRCPKCDRPFPESAPRPESTGSDAVSCTFNWRRSEEKMGCTGEKARKERKF